MALSLSNALAKAQPLSDGSGQSSLPPPSAGKPATSLFGNLTATQSQGNAGTSQPQHSSNIFGNLSQPQQTGGLFGSSAQASNNQQQSQGSGLLGGSQINQSAGGGLFASQQNLQQTNGLFGSGSGQTQPGGSLFGGVNNHTKSSSLFGNTQAPAQTQQNVNQAPAASLFASQIGQYQKQQVVPGVVLNLNELRPTTRFNDLHEDLKKSIEFVDNFISSQIHKQEDCSAANEGIENMSAQMPLDIDYCGKTLQTMQQALENDAESIAFGKGLVKADFDNSKLSFKAIQNLSLPQQFHHSALRNSTAAPRPRGLLFPDEGVDEGPTKLVDYFLKEASEMVKTLDTYNRSITEVENYLKGVESNTILQMQQMMFTRSRDGGENGVEDQVRELAIVLREFGNGILNVATRVGDTREKVQEVMIGS